MDFKTRNPLLSQRWKLLPEHEKLALNRRARNEKVLDNAELTKRLLKTIGCQVHVCSITQEPLQMTVFIFSLH